MQVADTSCIIVTVGDNSEADMQSALNTVGGQVVAFTENITAFQDIPSIKKVSLQNRHHLGSLLICAFGLCFCENLGLD